MSNCIKTFGFERKSGILMPISSLPSPYGIGSFGKGAFDFIDFLKGSGQTCWQVLPLNPTSYGDSPYQSPASVAGNPYFIDLEILHGDGLLTSDELDAERRDDGDLRVDYGRLFFERYKTLRSAYKRFCEKPDSEKAEHYKFIEDNGKWINDYSLFMALKVHYNYRSWITWEECHKNAELARKNSDEFKEEAGFWKFVQYEFFSQWKRVLDYAHKNGIVIIGDMPIYVAHDSMDVWASPEEFLLDEMYEPKFLAGCPPDPYSETGQLWGNPIYNWESMENDGYKWWIYRVGESFKLYDLLRIDHFRGFAGYYSIPQGETTAMNGKWEKGPGMKLFSRIKEAYPEGKIIAEDLGMITDDVRELLSDTGFPGMKVLQFAFYDDYSEYLPKCYTTDNCIVYTSTHDSETAYSWRFGLDKYAFARFKRECPRKPFQTYTDAMIEFAMTSRANLAIVPMQDYLALSNDEGRMNVPSSAMGNWTWRVDPDIFTERLVNKIKRLTSSGERLSEKQ